MGQPQADGPIADATGPVNAGHVEQDVLALDLFGQDQVRANDAMPRSQGLQAELENVLALWRVDRRDSPDAV